MEEELGKAFSSWGVEGGAKGLAECKGRLGEGLGLKERREGLGSLGYRRC